MPFSNFNTSTLWTDPHISQRMLAMHLDETNPAASRPGDEIVGIISWLDKDIGLKGKKVLDLGCGPGLYASEMAQKGAQVTGIDFSQSSIDYAKSRVQAGNPNYLCRDYLLDDLPAHNDVVTLIYCDFCALPPLQRRHLLEKIHHSLNPGGCLVLDAYSDKQFECREESTRYAFNLMDGFWSAKPYFGFASTFLYPELKLALDRYLIVEEERSWEVFNWLQYFTPEELIGDLERAGFSGCRVVDILTGQCWDQGAREFALIARLA